MELNHLLDEANLPSENNTDNSWNEVTENISADNFQSLDASHLNKDRGPDGALPDITFMKLTDNSKFNMSGCFN